MSPSCASLAHGQSGDYAELCAGLRLERDSPARPVPLIGSQTVAEFVEARPRGSRPSAGAGFRRVDLERDFVPFVRSIEFLLRDILRNSRTVSRRPSRVREKQTITNEKSFTELCFQRE